MSEAIVNIENVSEMLIENARSLRKELRDATSGNRSNEYIIYEDR